VASRGRTIGKRGLTVGLGGAAVVLSAAAASLHLLGRRVWCQCGEPFLWSGDINTSHHSQHLADPYTFTHVSHGLGFYALLRLTPLTPAWRFVAALAVEAGWEIFENTRFVIDRYREATISLDYYGDSIVNSLGDIGACALGYAIAARLPWRWSLALFLVMEIGLLLTVRDNLTLNILMLLWPLDAVRRWQAGG
jgi:hypothetical protein